MQPTPTTNTTSPPFADPTALGLLGLAVGCAALLPIALGKALTPDAFRTAAWFCLLFGGGCQLIAGIMALANKNLLGGTLFTTFAFNWVINYLTLAGIAEGKVPNASVVFSVDVCFLLVFVVLTFAFGYFSKLLFAFLLDIDLLYLCRILRELTHSTAFALPIVVFTVALAGIALWLAFAILVNSSAGKTVFYVPGPLFKPASAAVSPS
jgi:uncharacterized protein